MSVLSSLFFPSTTIYQQLLRLITTDISWISDRCRVRGKKQGICPGAEVEWKTSRSDSLGLHKGSLAGIFALFRYFDGDVTIGNTIVSYLSLCHPLPISIGAKVTPKKNNRNDDMLAPQPDYVAFHPPARKKPKTSVS
ncbi:hypothetical protein NXS19_002807 [Fusarium pseudograminearum]|nr:hypothetical protein NXS19_002807 [Fusarium pseudograminearum]